MNSIIILDDVIHQDCFEKLQKDFLGFIDGSTDEDWFLLNTKHYFQDFCLSLINLAGTYYNLSTCGGYEFWIHEHTKPPTWHIDNDERRRNENNVMIFPICSIVYYLQVENLIGGELKISHNNNVRLNSTNAFYEEVRNNYLDNKSDDVIVPKTNRIVMFPAGMFHAVNSFAGNRISMVINPWDISKYKYSQYVEQ
jgi:hypothetical protein